MRIAIDARALVAKRPAGKEQFVVNFLEELFKLDRFNYYILYLNQDFKESLPVNFSERVIKAPNIFWHFFVIFDLFFQKPDIFFAPISYIVPALNLFSKNIIVVHDLAVFLPINTRPSLKTKMIEKVFLKVALKRATKIITVSENSKQDIIKIFKIKTEKISIIYQTVSDKFCPIEYKLAKQKVLEKFQLDKDFILFVGTLEPRKNLVRLIEAYHKLISSFHLPISNLKLVIAGKKGWYYQEIFNKVKELNLENKVIFLDYVPDDDLPYLYNGASCFVYPSLYEGFGLPPLEAMACGCSVITSNISSLPEVVGEAAILVNPYNVDEIAEAINKILINENLRQELKQKGLEQAQNFSWQKIVQEFLRAFGVGDSPPNVHS